MRKFLTASAATLAIAGMTLGAAAPADAQRWHGGHYGGYRGHYYHGGRAGVALGAGLLGLAAGAAIAGGPYYSGYYPGYYGYAYAPPPPPYYYGPVGCRSDWRWDGWARRYVRVRYCY